MTQLSGQIKRPNRVPVGVRLTTNRTKGVYDSVTVTDTSYTVFGKDFVLVDDDTAGSTVTVTLPPAIENTDKVIEIKKLGSTANVIIDGDGSDTVEGGPTFVISTQYAAYTLLCDGSGWWIV